MAESVPVAGDRHFSDTHWRSLRYLNLYRFVLAGLLFIASVGLSTEHTFFLAEYSRQHISVTAFYLLVTTLSVMPMARYRRHFNLQLSFHVLVDIIVLTTLMYASGGLRGGVGILLLVVLAGAGLVGQGKLVLSYAAMATLAVLGTEVYRALGGETDQQVFFQAGLLSSGFFATAISARLLAKRMLANEELARLRGVALADQTLISQRVIEEMQDGVLVVSQSGLVRQHNPRAERMLGVRDAADLLLQEYSAELSLIFQRWQSGEPVDQATFSVAASGLTLRPHFVPTETSDRDVLVFLEDMGRVHERARQLKLAALGRLTANIAHEIRNPLSSISHASELLAEERREETQDRLLRIVKDNTQRLELIVRNVLELGRRDHIHREPIDLATFLPMFLDELCVKEKIDAEVIQLRMHDSFSILFDRAHLHQVLWNLLVNALRYSQRMPASVMIELHCDAETKTFELHLTDDGEGIAEGFREQVFEPFFTTHSRGTGLGLYIARELCEANSARIDLLDNAPGAHFRIKGESASDSQSL